MTPRLTIVIPTYNRPDFLARALRYFSAQRVRYPVVIADSSAEAVAQRNAATVAGLREILDLTYRRYPESISVAAKIADALDAVRSQYAALSADDDFTVPRSLEAGCGFLDQHQDYALVHGEAGYFVLESGATASGRILGIRRYTQTALEQPSASARLLAHLQRYATTFYSLHRTEALRANWQRTAALDLDYRFVELVPSCLAVLQGKSYRQPMLHIVRQGHATQTSAIGAPAMTDWISTPAWARQYQAVIRLLAEELSRHERLDVRQAEAVVQRAWSAYVACCRRKDVARAARRRPGSGRLRAWAARVPSFRRLWNVAKAVRPAGPRAIGLEAWRRRGSVFYEDFRPIDRVITDCECPPSSSRVAPSRPATELAGVEP